MSTPSPKKAPSSSTASDRRPPSSQSAVHRSPSRMAAQTTTSNTNTTSTSISRTRSAQTSTPVSARAAARKTPATSTTTSSDAEDEAKMEMQGRMAELQEKLQQSELAHEDARKHIEVLQLRLDEAAREQGMMEERAHEHAERAEELEVEKKESLRARRELEQIYEAERVQAMREKEEADAEREILEENMQRLRETLAQRELRERTGIHVEEDRRASVSRTSSMRSDDPSPNPETRGERGFAPQSSLQRSDSRSSSRLVLQKDKVIESLRLELAEAQIRLVELEHQGGGTMHQLEKDMYEIKMQNARLMEENESFQLLLSEKTLNGDLAQSELLRPPSTTDSPSRSSSVPRQRTSLADELGGEGLEADGGDAMERRLQAEVGSLKDQNKALTLYINNIISRLLQHEQFEAILDKTPDLMAGPNAVSRKYAGHAVESEQDLPQLSTQPPPAPEPQQSGLLQRASSVLRRKPRPVSQIPPTAPSADQPRIEEPTLNENPETAPRIPFAQASAARTAGAHRRTRSDWGAAAVVGNMYKGPSSMVQGPISPGLAPAQQPTRPSFFPTLSQNQLAPGDDGRRPSSTSVPSISESERDKENLASAPHHRDSKVGATSPERPRSNGRDSRLTDYPHTTTFYDAADGSNPSSPPQSTTSSGDRDARASGAIMMGSKPRPLRLVQEADEKKAANRQSWFGWMNKGGAAAAGPGGGNAFGGFLQGRGEGGV